MTLLDLPSPQLLAYPRETVVSEKLEAMVKLSIANRRMKDFHDLHALSTLFGFDGKTLANAIQATFKHRGTELPSDGVPLAFALEFLRRSEQGEAVVAFCDRNRSYVQNTELKDIVAGLASFLVPVIDAVIHGTPFQDMWKRSDTWHPTPAK